MTHRQHWYRTVYLHSDHWLALRADQLALHPNCQNCGNSGSCDVHHRQYRNLWDCTTRDLQTLCRKCHKTAHLNCLDFSRAVSRAIEFDAAKRNRAWLDAQHKKGVIPWTEMTGGSKQAADNQRARMAAIEERRKKERTERRKLLPTVQKQSFKAHLLSLGLK